MNATDKDREYATVIMNKLKSIQAKVNAFTQDEIDLACHQRDSRRLNYLTEKISEARAESAEQARKEAADRACRICRIISKPQCLRDTDCMTRMAILTPLQNVGKGE